MFDITLKEKIDELKVVSRGLEEPENLDCRVRGCYWLDDVESGYKVKIDVNSRAARRAAPIAVVVGWEFRNTTWARPTVLELR